jgi:hypothetical protein
MAAGKAYSWLYHAGGHIELFHEQQLVTDLCTLRDFTNNIWGFCGKINVMNLGKLE